MNHLYVFIDESGNTDFSPKGTKYWALTSMAFFDLDAGRDALHTLKFQALEEGRDVSFFHATTDRQLDRDRVYEVLKAFTTAQARVDTVVAQKNLVPPEQYDPIELYCYNMELLLGFVFDPRAIDVTKYDKVVIILDRVNSKGASAAMLKALKVRLTAHLRGVPYVLYFHPSSSVHGLQLVDYASWAIYKLYEDGEVRPWGKIAHLVKSRFDYRRRWKTYYEYGER